jgi:hypothetical protein
MAISNEELARILQQGTAGGEPLSNEASTIFNSLSGQGLFDVSQSARNFKGLLADPPGFLESRFPSFFRGKQKGRRQAQNVADARALGDLVRAAGGEADVATGQGVATQLQSTAGLPGAKALVDLQKPELTATPLTAQEKATLANTRLQGQIALRGEVRAEAGEDRAVTAEARAERQQVINEAAEIRDQAVADRLNDPTSLESLTRTISTIEAEGRLLGQPTPGAGQATIVSPITGQPQIVNLEGTEKFTAERRKMLGAQNAIRLSGQLAALTDRAGTSGTEMFGSLAVEIGAKRSQLMSAIFESRGLGAPQGPDIELVEAGLPDPTGFLNNVRGVFQGAVPGLAGHMKREFTTGFNEAGAEGERALMDILLETPQLINEVDQGILDPGSDLFELIEKLRTGE